MTRRTVLLGLLAAALVPASAHAYTVPPDNPFVEQAGARPEIYAYGLRNPFRWSFDSQTHDIVIGDVGQDAHEEVDRVPASQLAAANFGWDCFEGSDAGVSAGSDSACDSLAFESTVAPALTYDTRPSSHAVTGGVIIRDPALGSFDGQYLYSDFYDGELMTTTLDPSNPQSGTTPPGDDSGIHMDGPVAFGLGSDGAIYPVSLIDGTVSRLVLQGGTTLHLDPVASGLDMPMYAISPASDPHRLYIVERSGDVRVMVDGVMQPTPFLDIHTQVSTSTEQGMSTIAFPPDYATTGRLYVYYTDKSGNIRVDQFNRSSTNPNVVDPATEVNVLTIPHPTFQNHYGGQMNYGSDGYLYISTGDGGSSNDPSNNAQNLGVLLGKLLRIDPTTPLPPPGGGTPSPPPVIVKDTTAPAVSLGERRRQRVLRTHSISVSAHVNEVATVSATATVRTGGKAAVIRFRRATRRAASGQRVKLKLRLTKRGLRELRHAMSHHRTRVAHVTVTAKDPSGNARTKRVTIRLVH